MILFRNNYGSYILHTGDMRFNLHCLKANP